MPENVSVDEAFDDCSFCTTCGQHECQCAKLAQERLIKVQDQLMQKNCMKIFCPYCDGISFKRARTFCCDTMRHAVIAILSGERALKTAEAAEKAMQN